MTKPSKKTVFGIMKKLNLDFDTSTKLSVAKSRIADALTTDENVDVDFNSDELAFIESLGFAVEHEEDDGPTQEEESEIPEETREPEQEQEENEVKSKQQQEETNKEKSAYIMPTRTWGTKVPKIKQAIENLIDTLTPEGMNRKEFVQAIIEASPKDASESTVRVQISRYKRSGFIVKSGKNYIKGDK